MRKPGKFLVLYLHEIRGMVYTEQHEEYDDIEDAICFRDRMSTLPDTTAYLYQVVDAHKER